MLLRSTWFLLVSLPMLHSISPVDSADENRWSIREFVVPYDLPREVVRDVIMARDGSVWLATWGGGIVVLDGTNRRIIDTKDGLISDDVRVLEEDLSGRIWVGTANGISCIQNNSIINFSSESVPEIPLDSSVFAIKCMANGEVWFGDGHGHLYSWIPSDQSGDVLRGTWKPIHHFDESPHAWIREIHQDKNGDVWLPIFAIGIVHFKSPSDYQIIDDDLSSRALLITSSNHLLTMGYRWLVDRFENTIISRYTFPADVTCLLESFEKLFVGTEKGLYTVEDGELIPFSLSQNEQPFFIESLSSLNDGSLWVGTRSGAFRIVKPAWTKQSISLANVGLYEHSLVQNDRHQLFVLDYNNNLWMYENFNWELFYRFDMPINNLTAHRLFTYSNRLVALMEHTLTEFDVSKRKLLYQLKLPENLPIGGKPAIFLPNNQDIWFTGLHGLFKEMNSREYALPLARNNGKNVYTLFMTSPDEYWISGGGWIEHCVQGDCHEVELPQPLFVDSFEMTDVIQTQDGELWFAMLGEGILCYKDGPWRRISLEDGLPNNYIYTLFQSYDGTIWAGGRTRGVMSFKDDRWIQYNDEDGLPAGRIGTIVEDEEGCIWAGVEDEGVFKLRPNTDPPVVEITSAPDQLVPDSVGVFSHVGYDVWNSTKRDELVYSWRIVDRADQNPVQDWSRFSRDTSALIQPLKPGNYIFEVRAQDKHRNTSLKPAQANFSVIPYFWMRYQFFIPVTASLTIILYTLGKWWTRIRNLKRNQHKLEEEIVDVSSKEQQKIARDLHDGIVREFACISAIGRALLEKLKSENSHYANELQALLKSFDTISLQVRKIEKGLPSTDYGDMGLIPALQGIVIQVQNAFSVQCRFDYNQPVNFQDKQVENIVCQIAHEALFNAAKHARATILELRLSLEPRHVNLTIQDNGIGIKDLNTQNGRGIQYMTHRANVIQAKLSITNQTAGGTQVTCLIPLEQPQS